MLNTIHQVVLKYTWAEVVLPPNQAAIAKWALRLEYAPDGLGESKTSRYTGYYSLSRTAAQPRQTALG